MTLTLFQNTYLVDAAPYLAGDTTFDGATTNQKEQALVNATRYLDDQPWGGLAKTTSQPLAWPRTAFDYWDPTLGQVVTVADSTVPTRLVKATAFLALHFLRYPEVVSGYDANFDELTVGPISLKNTNATSDPGRVPHAPGSVVKLISPLLLDNNYSLWWRAN